jgi:CBS-domain-containing membrane protein
MIARDVMTRDVVSVTLDTPVRKVASLLIKHRIGAVPVPLLSPVVASNLVVSWFIRFLRFELVSA